ncbi:MAG: hypothetical protein QOF41_2451 [Methylobacteriaceae bacterium]|jgi:hypothetical protein|nr:hypothetical protein [Methylobacteriaceae bacterium]
MATLQDILQSAQGGKAAENLAERFGISSEQAHAAIQALTPALSVGLERAIQNPGNLSIIVGQLTSNLHLTSYQNAAAAQSEAGVAGGSTILSHVFGDPNVIGQIAQQASRVTGLRPELLVQMLPVVATMLAGGLMNSLKSQGFGNILSQLGSGTTSGAGTHAATGGLAGLLSSIFGGLFGAITGGANASAPSGGQSGLDALRKMLQPGSAVDPQHHAAIGEILNRRA